MPSIILPKYFLSGWRPISSSNDFEALASIDTPTHVHCDRASIYSIKWEPLVTMPTSISLETSLSMKSPVAGFRSGSPPPATQTDSTPGLNPGLTSPQRGRKSASSVNIFFDKALFLFSLINSALHHTQLKLQTLVGSTVTRTGGGMGRPRFILHHLST